MAAVQSSAHYDFDPGVEDLALEDSSREPSTERCSGKNLLPASDASASDSDDSVATGESSMSTGLELDKRVWGGLPEDIRNLVLQKLPPAAYCRFRCVCRDWKQLLSPPPDWIRAGAHYLLATALGVCEATFFCPSEEKFFHLPFGTRLFKEMRLALHLDNPNYILPYSIVWELMDVDGGLFCYLTTVDGEVELCVCNPLTISVRLISPDFLVEERGLKVKLLVDQTSKTFKVVLICENEQMTGIYDSTKSRWLVDFESYPDGTNELFKWRNVIYSYNSKTDGTGETFFLALDVESGEWNRIEVELPIQGSSVCYCIASDQNQVLLVCFGFGRSRISFWKLRIDETCRTSDFSAWDDISIGQEKDIQRILASTDALVADTTCGAGYMCFLFTEYNGSESPMFLKYSFAEKRHAWIPLCSSWEGVGALLHTWEPSSEMDVGSNQIKIKI